MKRIVRMIVFLSIAFLLLNNHDLAQAADKKRDDYTFGEIEQTLVRYLKSSGKNYIVGSSPYNQFINDQMFSDKDKKLASRKDYPLICAYMAEYQYQFNLQAQMQKASLYTASFSTAAIKTKTLGEVKKAILAQEAKDKAISKPAALAAKSYSPSSARSYAAKWYNGRNPAYTAFPNDCTNFVSQILFAGGKKMVMPKNPPVQSKSTSHWYFTSNRDYGNSRSISWAGVPEFFSFWSRTQSTKTSTSKSTIIANSKSGDVVQFKKRGADRWSHTMFVYSKANSTIYLSGHTSNYLKRNIKDVSSTWAAFRVIKF